LAELVPATSPPSVALIELRARSACRGLDPALWYPEKGSTAKDGRVVCATCRVLPLCLEHALANGEKFGVWGGASERERRRLAVVWVQRAHDYRAGCHDPGCRWCRAVDAHRASCAGEREGPLQWNGAGARCGYQSTYARGCRCGPCSLAISPAGASLRAAGYDIPTWWASWFGDNAAARPLGHPHGHDCEGCRYHQRIVLHAKRLAEFDTTAPAAA
jgi:WhiB family redox-sensing transcriptional regulator